MEFPVSSMVWTALLNSLAKSSYGISVTRSLLVVGSMTRTHRGEAKAKEMHGVSWKHDLTTSYVC